MRASLGVTSGREKETNIDGVLNEAAWHGMAWKGWAVNPPLVEQWLASNSFDAKLDVNLKTNTKVPD